MAISPTNIRIHFTNYDIITNFLNLASCSEYFISIEPQALGYTLLQILIQPIFSIISSIEKNGLYQDL